MIALAVSNAGRRHWESERRIHVVQGEFAVTADPDTVLTTILGSCVSCCLSDPVAGVGGMNHFLLPGEQSGDTESLRYGVNSMELLVNGLLKLGARRDRLEAKVFGGARVVRGLSDIGRQNAEFAERFLSNEKIHAAGGDVGGQCARRLQFWAAEGRVRQLLIHGDARVFEDDRPSRAPPPAAGAKPPQDLFEQIELVAGPVDQQHRSVLQIELEGGVKLVHDRSKQLHRAVGELCRRASGPAR